MSGSEKKNKTKRLKKNRTGLSTKKEISFLFGGKLFLCQNPAFFESLNQTKNATVEAACKVKILYWYVPRSSLCTVLFFGKPHPATKQLCSILFESENNKTFLYDTRETNKEKQT